MIHCREHQVCCRVPLAVLGIGYGILMHLEDSQGYYIAKEQLTVKVLSRNTFCGSAFICILNRSIPREDSHSWELHLLDSMIIYS